MGLPGMRRIGTHGRERQLAAEPRNDALVGRAPGQSKYGPAPAQPRGAALNSKPQERK